MKAYSIDLRQRIVEAYLSKEESVRSCAQRFKVSLQGATKALEGLLYKV
jgi:transposase